MEVSIPCHVHKNGGIIATTIHDIEEHTEDGCVFHVITDMNCCECLRDVSVDSVRLSEYTPEALEEWLKAIKKEEETGKRQFYDYGGDEYWYQKNDFSRHFALMEKWKRERR